MMFESGSEKYHVSICSEKGPRKENQDYAAVACRSGGRLTVLMSDGSQQDSDSEGNDFFAAVLCDGMGGLKDGAHASHMIADAVMNWAVSCSFDGTDWAPGLKAALADAESDLRDKYPDSGTTVSIIIKDGNGWRSAHIGDSRCYAVSDAVWRTSDHSPVEEMFRRGMISEDEMNTHPYSNVVSKYIGGGYADQLEMDDLPGGWARIALCSDGVFGYMVPSAFEEALRHEADAQSLVDNSLHHGGRDNSTAVLIDRGDWTRGLNEGGDIHQHPGIES